MRGLAFGAGDLKAALASPDGARLTIGLRVVTYTKCLFLELDGNNVTEI